jgi:hypothetical protein
MNGKKKSRQQGGKSEGQPEPRYQSAPRQSSKKGKGGRQQDPKQKKRVYFTYEDDDSSSGEDGPTNHVQTVKVSINASHIMKQANARLLVKSPKADMTIQIDTGAEANLLPVRSFAQLYPECISNGTPMSCSILTPSLATLSAYNGTPIQHFGTLTLKCRSGCEQKWRPVDFYVCNTDGPNILGLHDSQALGLITMNQQVHSAKTQHPTEDTSL